MGPSRVVNSCTIDPPRTGHGGHERPPSCGLRTPVGFTEHPDEHRSQYPILLAVDQELGDGVGARGVEGREVWLRRPSIHPTT